MAIEIVQVDAFTQTPFAGNPAAICVLESPAETAWMQRVANEMNLAETAFLVPRGSAKAGQGKRDEEGFDLRWFTPTVEVDLCGHATLAAAHVLWQDGHLAADAEARFHCLSGRLGAHRKPDGAIALDFPAEPATAVKPPAGLLAALGVEAPRFVGRNRLDWLVEVADETAVRATSPDMAHLGRIEARGVMVTSVAAPGAAYDFVSRFFAPAAGVDEDSVTGSAHCCLGPYWNEKLGKDPVRGYQASARGGLVTVALRGDRVDLIGHAVTVMRGQLLV